MTFPQLPLAEEWRKQGFQILERELEKQIYPDGVPAEQAVHYLAFILDFNILVWLLAENNGYPVPEIWYKRLSTACEFLCSILDEEGNLPDIGDRDDGWVVRLDDRGEANNYRSILATASVILRRPDFKWAAKKWDEKSYWLLGEDGHRKFDEMTGELKNPVSRQFPDGGYCVMRDQDRLIILDCGPLGYLTTAAHGHADSLSLTVSIGGQPILIDPGTYAYQEGGVYRDYFRSTLAHNTLAIDGYNQSEMAGTFLWRSKANSRLIHWKSTPDYDLAIAEHEGYSKCGVTHQRIVYFLKPDYLLVADFLSGSGEHNYYLSWHFPGQSIIEQDKHMTKVIIREREINLISLGDRIMPAVRIGEEDPIQGWMSPGYGVLTEAPVLVYEDAIQLPNKLITGIYLSSVHGAKETGDVENKFESMLEELKQKGQV
jgi:Heparinase II/III-like protein/Heparinase II/III N-terminus